MSARRSLLLVVISAISALATGCASTATTPENAEEIVLQRSQARWNALLARDFAAAYAFATPAYRAVVPLERYGNQFTGPVQWESAKAHSAKCEEARCVVHVEMAFRLMLPGHMQRKDSTFFDETWVLENGQWYKFEQL